MLRRLHLRHLHSLSDTNADRLSAPQMQRNLTAFLNLSAFKLRMQASTVLVCRHRQCSYASIDTTRMQASTLLVCRHRQYSYASIDNARMQASTVLVCLHQQYSYACIRVYEVNPELSHKLTSRKPLSGSLAF
jgi:hypothetical protein